MAKKAAIIGISSILLVAMVVAVTVSVSRNNSSSSSEGGEISTSTKAVQQICQPTDYKEACVKSLSESAGNTSDPKELIKTAFNVAVKEISAAIQNSSLLQKAAKEPRAQDALENCKELLDFSINDLQNSFDKLGSFDVTKMDEYMSDLKTWLSGAITYQQTCIDGFDNTTGDIGAIILCSENMELKQSLNLKYFLGVLLLLNMFAFSMANKTIPTSSINWVITEAKYTRLCSTKKILTVNGLFPGPPLYVHKGDRVIVNVRNQAKYNITIHWHGVKQPRNPWSDGPEYVTQCPIKPGASFSYHIIFSTEEGTLWWHAHSDWSRATVHGPIIVYPKFGTTYPFPKPYAEFPIVLASWFKGDVMEIIQTALETGAEPNKSDAFTINGQPGDLYNCSKQGTFRILFDYGKTYLLRIINSIMNEEVFFMVAHHNLRVVGMDGAYVKPFKTNYIMITPGQAMDVLITANQSPSHYYMAARAYAGVVYDNTTATAIVQYSGNYTAPSTPLFPNLPNYTDINAVTNFTKRLRALASKEHPIDVPKSFDTELFMTISVGTRPCGDTSCSGPNGTRLAASLTNISYEQPEVDILQAYYRKIKGIYTQDFPSKPHYVFNYTADDLPDNVLTPTRGTKVKVLKYNSNVQIVFQGTNVLSAAENHPMHLHGFSFYVVGSGFGNFDKKTDPKGFNLVDPPELNTVGVPKNGWAVIRFKADNPGVWFMHCHLERHTSWGMDMVFIVKNGTTKATSLLQAPPYLNPC